VATHKSRLVKSSLYEDKYRGIPIDYDDRLSYLYDKLKINNKVENEILEKRIQMLTSLYFNDIKIVLFEIPEGAPRPRFRIINRSNFMNEAIANPNFVHVYSVNAHEDSVFMSRLLAQDLISLQNLICTPCEITINTYSPTPSYFNRVDTFLAELGLHRPIAKPDWDNIEKKYSDMFNHNIWLDDTLVIDGHIHKYYSILPRLEIDLRYLNMVYNRYQYNSIINRSDYKEEYQLKYFGG
jgi:Holliday junction resolvase RusA-like endonuclease